MGFLSKGLSKAALEQLRAIVREEASAEFKRLLTPAFVEAVTTGKKDLEELLDVVLRFDDLEARVSTLEKIVSST